MKKRSDLSTDATTGPSRPAASTGGPPSNVRRITLLVVLVLLHAGIALNVLPLAREMLYGDGSSRHMLVEPRHGFMRVPSSELAISYDAAGRIGADFAQIYFPTRSDGSTAYTTETTDPWHRSSRYAPFVHALCGWTICQFEFGKASLLHVSIQYAVFMGSVIIALVWLGFARLILVYLSFINALLFLTPVGLAMFERGQFSLYVASAYIWLLLTVLNRSILLGTMAAVLGYFKLTSLPFMFVTAVTWVMNARGGIDLYQRARVVATVGATILLLFMLFYDEGLRFLSTILKQEYLGRPAGNTLMNIAPTYVVKALPFALLFASVWLARKCALDSLCWFPLVLAVAVLFCVYPTVSYDYSAPTLYGLLPFVLWWNAPPGRGRVASNLVVTWGFPLFATFVSLAGSPLIPDMVAERIEFVYFGFGVLFLGIAFLGKTTTGTGKSAAANEKSCRSQ